MEKDWLKAYKDNYAGKSAEGKEIAEYLKETYNGAKYIPWATMERITYQQDPTAEFKTIPNENGGLVHTDSFINENSVENKDGIVSKTSAAVMSHFVKVSCTFMGKTFIEEYPIQEQDYSAAKIYNQNLVNKSIKRALAKVASRATGLGLSLYEKGDLQFDDTVEEEKKPDVKKTKKVEEVNEQKEVETNVEETPVVETEIVELQPTKYSKEIVELCTLIKNADKDKMTKVLQQLNTTIIKQHGFALSQDDSDNDLCEKLSHFKDTSVFTKAINTMLNNIN
jgi:hypothetical protein